MSEQRSQSRTTLRGGCIRVAKVGKRNITPIKGARWYYGGEFARTYNEALAAARTYCATKGFTDGAYTLKTYTASGNPSGEMPIEPEAA